MKHSKYISSIAELSESEGVFTTAQAARMGIPRDALHDAVESGRIERIMHGAYRLVGSRSSYIDELVAIWKLTAPSKFTHERIQVSSWDGIAIGGSTAASLLGIGDFYLSPYRIYTPKRINSRNTATKFTKRDIARDEITFINGLPVTCMERTIFDLVADAEDLSLVADTLNDAYDKDKQFDLAKLRNFFNSKYKEKRATYLYESLLLESDISEGVS